MKNVLFLTLIVSFLSVSGSYAQGKYFTRNGHTSFFSKASVEDIEAHNKQTTCILNTENGELVFSIPMKGFDFEKALMQEHFNENYVESDKFPKATFKGQIKDFSAIALNEPGEKEVTVSGDITIHGVTKAVEAKGVLKINDGKITAVSEFPLTVKDFDIKIPNAVIDNIAEKVTVKVKLDLEPYNN